MMSRSKAHTRDLELRLRTALEDLKASRELTDQLMKERDENEMEFECILKKNTVLKNQLVEQDIQYQDLQGKCDELNGLLRSYQQCQNIHEATLSQIHSLEQQLAEANGELQRRNEEQERDENDKTIALYEELINSQCKAVPTIDLTTPCKEPCEHKVTPKIIGANKLKKYCKINRSIKRCQHTLRKLQKPMKSIKEENVRLGLLVHKYEKDILVHRQDLSECNSYYEMNMAMLQRRLVNLESALNSTRTPYSGDKTTSPQMSAPLSGFNQSASPEQHQQPADSVLPTDNQLPSACPPDEIQPPTTTCNNEPAVATSSVLLTDTQLPPACTLHVNEPASTACNDEPATTVCNDEPAVPTSSPSPCDRSEIALSSTPSTCLLREAPYETIVFSDKLEEEDKEIKPFECLDVSCNGRVICAGSQLVKDDAFLVFWDQKMPKPLGGYWNSHTEDITQVKFHKEKPETLATGSSDGLMNIFNITEQTEDDALIYSLNVENSVEKLSWLDDKVAAVITQSNDLQTWDTEAGDMLRSYSRDKVAKSIKRSKHDDCYLVDAFTARDGAHVLLAGSYGGDGSCLRSVTLGDKKLRARTALRGNTQTVSCSWYQQDKDILVTTGEGGVISVWARPPSPSPAPAAPAVEKLTIRESKKGAHRHKPY